MLLNFSVFLFSIMCSNFSLKCSVILLSDIYSVMCFSKLYGVTNWPHAPSQGLRIKFHVRLHAPTQGLRIKFHVRLHAPTQGLSIKFHVRLHAPSQGLSIKFHVRLHAPTQGLRLQFHVRSHGQPFCHFNEGMRTRAVNTHEFVH
jgi:hypothetical protein